MEQATIDNRRFMGTQRLYGIAASQALKNAHFVVIGLGGVGSWAAECLARTGVGRLTLIDLDVVGESNINRQLHALDTTIGANKVDVMAQRIHSYAAHCQIHAVDDWVTPENVASILPQDADYVIDCIDQVKSKQAIAVLCQQRQQPLIVCGAAGGKTDLAAIRVADLAHVTHDPLLSSLRQHLRKQNGFAPAARKPSERAKPMGIDCVYLAQAVSMPVQETSCDTHSAASGLNCAGYGSVMAVTASMGLRAAHEAVTHYVLHAQAAQGL